MPEPQGWTPVDETAAWTPVAETKPSRPATSGSMALDFMQGGGAELIGTALGAYNLLRKIPGADKVLPPVAPEVQQYAEPPKTAAAKIGKLFTQAGEFMVPAGEVGAATKGAGLLARAGAQAATAGGVEAARTGGDVNKAIDAAALGAAGPIVGAGLKAAAPILRSAPGTAFDAAKMLIHPTPATAFRLASRFAGSAGKAAAEAAPEAAAAAPAAASEDQQLLDAIARGRQNAAAESAIPPQPKAPRPLSHYGVKAAEAPPTNPAPSAPAPTSAAAAAAPSVTKAPPATTEAQDIDFQQRYGEQEQPEVAKYLGHEQPKSAANIAKAAQAESKADRFVKAITTYNQKHTVQGVEPITADFLAGLDDSGKAALARALSGNGLLPKLDANKFSDTSWPYIVTKLRQAAYTQKP